MLQLEIDGKSVEVPEGSTVMDAANRLGVYIPHFCYHRKLSIAANCRMCLVQVEKAPKPLPACATPVTNGMKVQTQSDYAIKAQKSVMEFLLINHPLDCPICDQGGECQLQDLAVGYGGDASRYQEPKRTVVNKNLGPLISTDMTRCIHCTRCVRFGQEVAGIMELGMAHRGEHSEIMTFVERTVDSELSGNVIDLCPVGALTSKPFRYSARTWELTRKPSVSPHCGLGSNVVVQVKGDRVKRVLPRENEDINECWLSDKDRFAYEGLYAEDRLTSPMIRTQAGWRECDWQEALEFAASRLKAVAGQQGGDAIAALASPHQSVEELHLLARLVRGLGSDNVDHRGRQSDFRLDGRLKGAPWLGMKVAEVSGLKRVLVVGGNLRKDHPLLALRLRKAMATGTELSVLNSSDDPLLVGPTHKLILAPALLVVGLARVVVAAAAAKGAKASDAARAAAQGEPCDASKAIAASLLSGDGPRAVFMGNLAQHHPAYAVLHSLAAELAALTGARLGTLGEAANSVGAQLAGALPASGGANALAMFRQPRKAYLLLGAEPELDCYDPRAARVALAGADCVVVMSAFRGAATEYAHVLLPIAPFTETSGTFVSTEGRAQSFSGVVKPLGDARPGWKVLRVLGQLLGVAGMDYESSEAVRKDVLGDGSALAGRLSNDLSAPVTEGGSAAKLGQLERVGDVPIYFADPLVRRAPSLQKTADARVPAARMNSEVMAGLGVKEGDTVLVRQGVGEARLAVARDDSLPGACVRVAAGHPLTAGLGGMLDPLTVERA